MFCSNCGNKLNDSDKFCDKCGTPVEILEGPVKEAEAPGGEKETGSEAGPGAEAELDATVSLDAVPDAGKGAGASGDEVPNLEKKIMENMEDELILEMPEAAGRAGASYGGYQGEQPQNGIYGSHGRNPGTGAPGGYGNTGRNGQNGYGGHGGAPMPGGAGQNPYGGQQPPEYEYINGGKKPEKKKPKKKKALIITLVSVLAAVIIALAVVAFLLTNPANKLRSAIKDRDWTKVESIYESKFAGNDKKEEKADEILRNEVEKLKSAYISGEMDYQTVKRHLTAIEKFWDDPSVETALEELRALYDSRSAFEDGEFALAAGNYAAAIKSYSAVVASDPNYEKAQEQLETAKASYKEEVLSNAAAYEELKNYEDAIEEIEDALKVLPGDSDLKSRLEALKEASEAYAVEEVLTRCRTYAGQGNYYNAMEAVGDALDDHPGNTELQNALKDYSAKYQEDILKKAEEALGSDENYETAIIVLDGALNTLDGDYPEIERVLREKREEYVQAQLSKSKAENVSVDFVGSWRGSWVSGGGLDMSASSFLSYAGFDQDQLFMRMDADGTLYVQLLGESAYGTWQKKSHNEYTLIVEGEGQAVFLENGKLTMDLDGVVLTFEKETAA